MERFNQHNILFVFSFIKCRNGLNITFCRRIVYFTKKFVNIRIDITIFYYIFNKFVANCVKIKKIL